MALCHGGERPEHDATEELEASDTVDDEDHSEEDTDRTRHGQPPLNSQVPKNGVDTLL